MMLFFSTAVPPLAVFRCKNVNKFGSLQKNPYLCTRKGF